MRAVIGASPDVVEGIVIEPGQPFGALRVFPYPFGEAVFDLLLRFAGGNRLRLVDDASIVGKRVVNRRRPHVERVLDQGVGGYAPGAVGHGIADRPARKMLQPDRPACDSARMVDEDIAFGEFQQLADKIPYVTPWYPGRAQPRFDIAGQQIGRLHGFQGFDVALIDGIDFRRSIGDSELGANIAA